MELDYVFETLRDNQMKISKQVDKYTGLSQAFRRDVGWS